MDFAAAEQSFQQLEAARQAGQIDEPAYREQLEGLRVVDAAGRTWMPQEGTGQWHVLVKGQWQAATPPGSTAPPPPPPTLPAASPPASSVPPTTKPSRRRARRRRPGCVGITLQLLLWAFCWALAAWALDSLVRTPPLWAYPAVGCGAVLTLVLWVRWMTRFGRAARKSEPGGAQ